MKITGGTLRGRRLEVVRGVRPTGGRAREALFSRWQATIPGCEFLDLFAGSGAVGLEAASRGAGRVVLVERSPKVVRALIGNLESLAPEGCSVLRATLPRLPAALAGGDRFDHVFADPPYAFEDYGRLLEGIAGLLRAGGKAAIEHSGRVRLESPVANLMLEESRDYGESRLSFFAAPSVPASVAGPS